MTVASESVGGDGLAIASIELFELHDYEALPPKIAALAVPELADYCLVDVAAGGQLHPAAARHADPRRQAAVEALHRRLTTAGGALQSAQARALESGEALLVNDTAQDALGAALGGEERSPLELEPRSLLVLPLHAGRSVEGVLTLVRTGSFGRAFGAAELPAVQAFARRAGLALEAARVRHELEQVVKPRLERTEAQLAQAQSVAHVGSFEWEIGPNLVTISDEAHRLLGLAPGEAGRTFEDMLARVHPEDRERTRGILFEALRSQSAFGYDHRVVRADGSVRVFHTRGWVVPDAHGKPVYVVGTSWDITDRTSAARAYEHSNSLLEATIEATADAVLVVDRAGRIVLANERFSSLWKVPRDRIARMDSDTLFDTMVAQVEDPDGFRAGVLALAGRPEDESADRVLLKDGRVLERLSRPQRIGDAVVGRVWTFHDVSDREHALSRAVLLADVTRLLASLEIEQALAAVASRLVPRLGWSCIIELSAEAGAPSKLEAHHCAQHAAASEAHPAVREGRTLLYRTDSTACLGVPIFVQGKVAGALTLSAAPGREYGDAERELAQELARRAGLSLENARLYRQAQDALRARDEFLAVAAHEIRAPIATLHLAVQVLRDERTPADVRANQLEVIERQDRRLGRFVEELLDLARIRSGTLRLAPEDNVDLAEIARSVANRLSAEIARSGSRLELAADEPVLGRWDRLRLDQIVTNLLSNAIKFGQGKPIRVEVSARGQTARLTVADQGIGIAPELQARIFQAFERGISVRHYGGLGLGLYIVKTLVCAMGGSVNVSSAAGEGATFTVELPRA